MAYASITDLKDDVISEVKIELQSLGEAAPPDEVIELKVRDAIREVKMERNYPSNYTDRIILADLERLFSVIKAKSIYKGNLIGSEFQSSDSENGQTRVWIEYERLSNGVIPISRCS